jgi:hypothetical protein
MSQEQNKTISGSVYQVYTPKSQEFKENRMPRIGQTVEFEDGRKYVFASTQVDIGAGLSVAAPASSEVVASGGNAAGESLVVIVDAGIAANAYAGGYLVDDASKTSYKIKGNRASATIGAVDDLVIVYLYDSLVASVADGAQVTVLPFLHGNTLVGGSSTQIVGFTHVPSTAATSGETNYLWLQYQGVGPLAGVVLTPGDAFQQSAAGAIIAGDGSKAPLGTVIANDAVNSTAYYAIEGGC